MMSSTKPVDLAESVAGEEDPGASNEIGSARETAPGDEAPPGTRGTGEKQCPDCGGSGRKAGGACPTCGGTGKVTAGIGGA
jgi:DnaJ-class molecular chaperone